jgi:acyl-CoA thioesterase-1
MRRFGFFLVSAMVLPALWNAAQGQIVAFGASNISGWNVVATQALPAQLEAMLRQKGYTARVVNAGVYGNTTAQMLARIDTDIPPGTKIVILDTSGGIFNDLNKGISRQQGDADMAAIQARLRARGIAIIPVSGTELPAQYHQQDGAHLTPEGHRLLASQILPQVEQVLGPPQVAQTPSQTTAPSTAVVDACAADARRLCASVLGDEARRHECMHEHRAELSHDCLAAIIKSRQ